MFVGHLAVALAAKKRTPQLSLGILVGATAFIDLIWSPLLLLGLERVRIDPGNTAFTPLAFAVGAWLLPLWAGWADAHRRPRVETASRSARRTRAVSAPARTRSSGRSSGGPG